MRDKCAIALIITFLFWTGFGWADEPPDSGPWQKRAVLRAGQEVLGDYFAFGPHVEISGTVHGDVYAAGGEVLVDGTVEGDLIVAGGDVTMSGKVARDVRVAGGNVTISGQIDGNASVAGGDVHLTDSAHVQGNLLIGAGNVQLAGAIDHDARVGTGNVTVSNRIGGDLSVAAVSIRLTSKASIGKNVRYWSEEELSVDEGTTVGGTVSRREIPESLKAERFRRGLAGLRIAAGIVSFVSTLVLGLLLVRIYPVFSQNAAGTIQERPWASLGVGGAVLVGVPLLIFLCLVTVVGIPIGLVLGAVYLATLYLGRVFVMLWAGQILLRSVSASSSIARAFVTGLVVYSVVSLVPLMGKLVTFLTVTAGLGAILIIKKDLVMKLRAQKVV